MTASEPKTSSRSDRAIQRIRGRAKAQANRQQQRIQLLQEKLAVVQRILYRKRQGSRLFGEAFPDTLRAALHLSRVQTLLDILSPHIDSGLLVPLDELMLDLRADEGGNLASDGGEAVTATDYWAARYLGLGRPGRDLGHAIEDARFHEMTFDEMVRVRDDVMICLRGHYGSSLKIHPCDPTKPSGTRLIRKRFLQVQTAASPAQWRRQSDELARRHGLIRPDLDENTIPRWVRPPGIAAWLRRIRLRGY